jgi:hypothetical protein
MSRRTIPEIRARLFELADAHGIPELAVLAEETKREYHGRAGRTDARKVTPELAEQVRAYAARHPGENHRNIGAHFGIDGGRVSEILHGKRGER